MLLHVVLYTILGCAGMAIQDVGGTYLNIAENHNQAKLAARLDVICDLAKFVMFSFSGEKLMTMGFAGWLGIPFILATGYIATLHATRKANETVGK